MDAALEQAIRERFENSDFVRWSGVELASVDDGRSEIRLALKPHHLNPGGIAHGGIIAAMLDMAVGVAQRTELGMAARHVTVNLDVNYLRPARAGVLIARGESVRSGERIGYGESTLLDEHGTVLARGTATFLVVSGELDGE